VLELKKNNNFMMFAETLPAFFVSKLIHFNVHVFTQSSMEVGRAKLWYIEGRQVSIRHFLFGKL
jgi:hypothetical protein